jgi:hypothetical protein
LFPLDQYSRSIETATPNSTNNNGFDVAQITGIVIGILAMLVALVTLFLKCWYKRRRIQASSTFTDSVLIKAELTRSKYFRTRLRKTSPLRTFSLAISITTTLSSNSFTHKITHVLLRQKPRTDPVSKRSTKKAKEKNRVPALLHHQLLLPFVRALSPRALEGCCQILVNELVIREEGAGGGVFTKTK